MKVLHAILKSLVKKILTLLKIFKSSTRKGSESYENTTIVIIIFSVSP